MPHPAALRALALGLLFCAGCAPDPDLDFDGDGVPDALDCAPQDPERFEGAADPPGDELDSNCDGLDGVDADGDGYAGNRDPGDPLLDCDDQRSAAHPGAEEIPGNGADEDCDGQDGDDRDGDGTPDAEDCSPDDAALNEEDRDGDGASTCAGDCDDQDADANLRDVDGDGTTTCEGDCDDADPTRNPGVDEVCDGVDGNCDGVVPVDESDADGDTVAPCEGDCDDGDPLRSTLDGDGDGATGCGGDCDDEDAALNADDVDGDAWSTCDGDCDDEDGTRHPLAAELCDGLDGDCVGGVPTDEVDGDGDGALLCADCDDDDSTLVGDDADNDGFDPCTGDCLESDPLAFPFAPDAWGDGIDQSCDGVDGFDFDRDGFLDNATDDSLDCDDEDASLNRADADGDGVDTCAGDCDDGDPDRFPGQVEDACDGVESDCVPDADELDGDGDGFAECAGDCDDNDPNVSPADADGDGFDACSGNDCDDNDASRFPGNVLDRRGDGVDSNCDGHDGYRIDTADIVIEATEFSLMGYGAAFGEFDGQPGLDLALGAPDVWDTFSSGRVYLFAGELLQRGARLTTADAWATLLPPQNAYRFGGSLQAVDDLDGDGLDELLIGAGDEDQYIGALGSVVQLAPGAALTAAAGETPHDPAWLMISSDPGGRQVGWRIGLADLDDDGAEDLVFSE